ncbi:dienelactone hydrolase family protein [Pseudacidobacterium ailaaui]|jgi:carboxymethylenebutenolidase|uniref:dienelactone hydrolase family protein n=1 Tax=Pseudacidobacterium ailaaui TaxID=1382359 RepID=UPI00047D18A8|nr:dienelactone hydrolase family protein [Pseudacidobacterium ailaaui]MDI3253783.1 dienelactone hydrolase family protein [Bacillota bacterium]
MKRFCFCVLLLCSLPLMAATPERVTFPSGSETASGLLYLPSGAGPHPAIIVIHEWWGLNDWIKEQANELAGEGYVALAVDLYRGQVASDPEMAHELSRGLPQDRGIRDLVAAFDFLAKRKDVDPQRIGAVGWCMGGGYAAQFAVAEPNLRAVAINYGPLPTEKAALARIHAMVLGNFGGQDRGIPPSSVEAFVAAMKDLHKEVDAKIYPDAGHAFENPNNSQGYKPEDAKDAQERMKRFFARTLKGNG